MKRLFVPALALALFSCGTIGSIRYDFASGGFGERTSALANACAARMGAPALDPLRGKVELLKTPPDGPVPFTILTNKSTAVGAEQQAIRAWAKLMEQCQAEAQRLLDGAPVPPGATASEVEKLKGYITDAWIGGAKLRVSLYNGDLTYAEYASRRLSMAEDTLKTAERYAQDEDEENNTHDLEDVETALAPFAALM